MRVTLLLRRRLARGAGALLAEGERMRRLLKLLAVVLGVAACTGVAAAAGMSADELAPYLQPQTLVDVGGHKINLYCTGQGSPTVVLDAGEAETMYTWRKVQPVLAGTRIRGRGVGCHGFRRAPQRAAQLRRDAAYRADRGERHRRA